MDTISANNIGMNNASKEKYQTKDNNPTISVIMGCYNSNKEYLIQAINSILNQTYTDFEFLIKNEGNHSFDFKEFIKSFKDKRIRYFEGKRMGIAETYNYLISKSKGKYIALQEHDDISLPNRLELSLTQFHQDPDLTTVSGRIHIFGNVRERDDGEQMLPGRTREELVFFQPIKNGTVVLNKSKFIENKIKFNKNYTQCFDYELWSRIRKMKHLILDNVVYNYRKHENADTVKNREKVRSIHALIVQRNLKEIEIEAPIELCQMLDPFNHTKQDKKYVDLFISFKDKLLKEISIELYNRKLNGIKQKVK